MHGMISIMKGLKNCEKLCIIHGETKSWVGGGWVGGWLVVGGSHAWDDQHNDGLEKS